MECGGRTGIVPSRHQDAVDGRTTGLERSLQREGVSGRAPIHVTIALLSTLDWTTDACNLVANGDWELKRLEDRVARPAEAMDVSALLVAAHAAGQVGPRDGRPLTGNIWRTCAERRQRGNGSTHLGRGGLALERCERRLQPLLASSCARAQTKKPANANQQRHGVVAATTSRLETTRNLCI